MIFLLASEQLTVSLRTGANPSDTASWFSEGFAGIRQHAYQPDAVYTPLFGLRMLLKPLLRR